MPRRRFGREHGCCTGSERPIRLVRFPASHGFMCWCCRHLFARVVQTKFVSCFLVTTRSGGAGLSLVAVCRSPQVILTRSPLSPAEHFWLPCRPYTLCPLPLWWLLFLLLLLVTVVAFGGSRLLVLIYLETTRSVLSTAGARCACRHPWRYHTTCLCFFSMCPIDGVPLFLGQQQCNR